MKCTQCTQEVEGLGHGVAFYRHGLEEDDDHYDPYWEENGFCSVKCAKDHLFSFEDKEHEDEKTGGKG